MTKVGIEIPGDRAYNLGSKEHSCPLYNLKLINYNIDLIFCQERNKKMDGTDVDILRKTVIKVVQECTDPGILDLVYKLLCFQ